MKGLSMAREGNSPSSKCSNADMEEYCLASRDFDISNLGRVAEGCCTVFACFYANVRSKFNTDFSVFCFFGKA